MSAIATIRTKNRKPVPWASRISVSKPGVNLLPSPSLLFILINVTVHVPSLSSFFKLHSRKHKFPLYVTHHFRYIVARLDSSIPRNFPFLMNAYVDCKAPTPPTTARARAVCRHYSCRTPPSAHYSVYPFKSHLTLFF